MLIDYLYACSCSGQDHTVTQNIAVAIQGLENQLQTSAFMDFGLRMKMARTHKTVTGIMLWMKTRYILKLEAHSISVTRITGDRIQKLLLHPR
jgi:hypothetical protein